MHRVLSDRRGRRVSESNSVVRKQIVDFGARALESNCSILGELWMIPVIILGKHVDSTQIKRTQENIDTTNSEKREGDWFVATRRGGRTILRSHEWYLLVRLNWVWPERDMFERYCRVDAGGLKGQRSCDGSILYLLQTRDVGC